MDPFRWTSIPVDGRRRTGDLSQQKGSFPSPASKGRGPGPGRVRRGFSDGPNASRVEHRRSPPSVLPFLNPAPRMDGRFADQPWDGTVGVVGGTRLHEGKRRRGEGAKGSPMQGSRDR
eukprot:scaffold358_cov343-Pavlova_lutheri.AAC.20